MRMDSTILATTCTNGARIGTTLATMHFHPNEIQKGHCQELAARLEAARGGITLKSRAPRPAPAFRLNSSTRIMAFVWRELWPHPVQ